MSFSIGSTISGVRCLKPEMAGALGELELEFALRPFLPWNLVEQGTEWTLATKTELLELPSGVSCISSDKLLADWAKAVALGGDRLPQKGDVGFKDPYCRDPETRSRFPISRIFRTESWSTLTPGRNSAGGGLPRRRSWP